MSEHHKHSKPVEGAHGVVTSDAVQGKRRVPKNVLIIIAVVAGAILLAGAVFAYKHYIYDPLHKPPVSTPSRKPNRNALKQFDTALSDAQTKVESAKTKSEKAGAYINLGVAYMNKNDNKDAINALNNAIAEDPSSKMIALSALAFAYAYDGQRDQAITAFQELIDLLKQQGQDSDARIQAYQNDLDRLQAGQSL